MENKSGESSTKRTQMSDVIDVCCSVARVRTACRSQLNSTIIAIKNEINEKAGKDGAIKWSSLSKDTRAFLEKVAAGVKVKEEEKKPDPKSMDAAGLTSLARSRSFKLSQFANVAVTCAVDFVVQQIVRLAMTTAKGAEKNNILPSHIVNDDLKASNVFALIYNLEIIDTHDKYLAAQEQERLQKIADKEAARAAAKEERKRQREEDKKNGVKSTKKKEGKKEEKKQSKKKKGESSKKKKPTSKSAKKDAKKRAPKKDVLGSEYMYYVDKIIINQKTELGEDYKNMRASAYFRNFCTAVIAQLISRMTSQFSILAELGGMKTITDSIVRTSLNLILVDSRTTYPELIDAVDKSVEVYRAYRADREKNADKKSGKSSDDDDDDEN